MALTNMNGFKIHQNFVANPTQVQAHCNPPSCGCKELSRQR